MFNSFKLKFLDELKSAKNAPATALSLPALQIPLVGFLKKEPQINFIDTFQSV